jgi:Fe-S-cluster containining protein
MMLEKIRAVETLFEKLDQEISTFQGWSGISCASGCGKCCYKPDIEATILELLPFALYLYSENLTSSWIQKANHAETSLCLILSPSRIGGGLCSVYKHRPLICRLFGYSARIDKYGRRELMSCKTIKSEQSENFTKASDLVLQGELVPLMTQYYMQLRGIDFELANEYFPVNEAIKRAIEVILHYYAYRG